MFELSDSELECAAKILALCVPMTNGVMEEKERVALFLCQAKREHSGLAPQLPSRMSLMSESKRD